jgi:hypothetical protein
MNYELQVASETVMGWGMALLVALVSSTEKQGNFLCLEMQKTWQSNLAYETFLKSGSLFR